MKNFSWKKVLPHIIALGVFIIVALIYCHPALDGKVLQQADIVHWKGMAQDAFNYKEKHGHFPLWNTHLFSGMPNYQVAIEGKSLLPDLNAIFSLGLPVPASYFFIACLCFYILSMSFGLNYLVAIFSSLAYAYASYDPVILIAGHDSKMSAIAYMPGLLAGLVLLYNRKYIIGLFVTALFATMELVSNHPQIFYYALITSVVMTIFYIVRWIKAGEFKHMAIALSLALLGGAIGVGNSAITLLTTYDYARYTMRGGKTLETTEAGAPKTVKTTGLDIDYGFSYSFGKSETITLMMPQAFGGSSAETYDENSKVVSALVEKNIPESNAVQLAGSLPKYWGGLDSTAGPVYLGAIICFLAVIGFVVSSSFNRWWILTAVVLTIFMAWGKYFYGFNEILFNHLPLYNKFRAPSMSLVIPQLLLPLMAGITLQQLLLETSPEQLNRLFKKILYAAAALLGIAVIVYLFNGYNSFIDEQIIKAYTNPQNGSSEMGHLIVNAMIGDRKAMLGAGIFRALLFGVLVIALLFLYMKKMLKAVAIIVILIVANTTDLLATDSKYLSSNNFQDKDSYQSENFTPDAADKLILQDTSSHYRVYNLRPDRFMEAVTSYFHRNIGGYHAAKLRIYQDLIENQLSRATPNMRVLNMLDTRYFIIPAQQNSGPSVQRNDSAMGACWLVKNVTFVNGPAEEMKALDSFNPLTTAIADNSFKSIIGNQPGADTTARIELVNADNDHLVYRSQAAANQFAVLSEIYYPSGWNAYIDGKKTDYAKVNYVLRGIAIPAGAHTVEFKFEPSLYHTGQTLNYIANILLWLSILAAVFTLYKRQKPGAVA
ncbi:YfhO family protein [Deminuibacter soli]|uniref:YfhO family protein n=1 Tax=Deminuibacter soli TaxID=2291815 RepID=A0A3E1NEZ0_9BACT|nr:YfhO family protein [Deminuibacter soli]RFM26546.1 hypothetical protein DXN05_19895 [Deminuibacter soli]